MGGKTEDVRFYRLATPGIDQNFEVSVDGVTLDMVTVPFTTSYFVFETLERPAVFLDAGKQLLRVTSIGRAWNFDFFTFNVTVSG